MENISAQGDLFFTPIFVLKPWDWDDRFEHNKRYKRGKRIMKILSVNVKNWPKAQNCRKPRPDWVKRLFIKVSLTPNRVESSKISQTTRLLFPSVVQNWCWIFSKFVDICTSLVVLCLLQSHYPDHWADKMGRQQESDKSTTYTFSLLRWTRLIAHSSKPLICSVVIAVLKLSLWLRKIAAIDTVNSWKVI